MSLEQNMNDITRQLDEMARKLEREAGELRVKVHLAKMEASDEWKELEEKLAKLKVKTKELGGVTAEASKDIGAAASLLGEEIRNGIQKFTKRL
jgi:chromosome segregation ATPase